MRLLGLALAACAALAARAVLLRLHRRPGPAADSAIPEQLRGLGGL